MARYLPHQSLLCSVNVATHQLNAQSLRSQERKPSRAPQNPHCEFQKLQRLGNTVGSITLTQTLRNVTQGMTTWLTESSETATPGLGELQAVSRVDGNGGR